MPRVNWGIDADVIDDWDRSQQFKPYTGPKPANGVYKWRIATLKAVAGTKDKYPQLRAGLVLTPRKGYEEDTFKGYYITLFLSISESNPFTYAPFCDAIGVSGQDFTRKTVTDSDGNVKSIGRWRMDGKTEIYGQLRTGTDSRDGTPRPEIGWVGSLDEELPDTDDDTDSDDDDSDDDPF